VLKGRAIFAVLLHFSLHIERFVACLAVLTLIGRGLALLLRCRVVLLFWRGLYVSCGVLP
jgi:hypothetical protein